MTDSTAEPGTNRLKLLSLQIGYDPTSPPPYTNSEPSSSSQAPFVLPANAKPCNFVILTQKRSPLKGTYILDPSLDIPSAWLPPLPEDETEETRSNFYAKSEHGDVASELYLLDKPILRGRKKVLLNVLSGKGTASVHIEGPSPPFTLHSHSNYLLGGILVKIPRSFKGSITVGTKDGPVLMSDAISSQASVFNDAMVLNNESGCATISFEDEDFVGKDTGCLVG
ncbi:hypothetical protein BDP27DRAFT_1320678 [Rhodocollybia butyracea]|uniref:DUF7330 domain-containing protein n=1 Tax=Rhodocollybia butyracea TaxID=206335 RepID=A0A9P5PZZ9_9AGAR|nr:hypothetical protein BDP27DRAFT_1320678 [Rhodocollybia butyracea]